MRRTMTGGHWAGWSVGSEPARGRSSIRAPPQGATPVGRVLAVELDGECCHTGAGLDTFTPARPGRGRDPRGQAARWGSGDGRDGGRWWYERPPTPAVRPDRTPPPASAACSLAAGPALGRVRPAASRRCWSPGWLS